MNLSIEDYRQKLNKGETHFFPNIKHKRYHAWVGGGGLGEDDNLDDARRILFNWAVDRLDDDITELTEKLSIRLQAKRQLKNPIDLQIFKVKEKPHEQT
jgi:hypothetical protein